MELIVTRDTPTPEETIGTLSIDGQFFGYTLELPEGISKVAGIVAGRRICIPVGEYKVKVTFSQHMNKRLPLIYNDENSLQVITSQGIWSGVRFHGGNTYLDSLACILVGRNKFINTPSTFYDKTNHIIRNFIQGSLSDILSSKLDNGEVHHLTIQ